jgi:hypothetical protein
MRALEVHLAGAGYPGRTAFLFSPKLEPLRDRAVHIPAHALGERSAGVRAARAEPHRRLAVGAPCGSKAPPFFEPVAALGLLLDAMSRASRPSPHLTAGEPLIDRRPFGAKASNTCRLTQNPVGFSFARQPTHRCGCRGSLGSRAPGQSDPLVHACPLRAEPQRIRPEPVCPATCGSHLGCRWLIAAHVAARKL